MFQFHVGLLVITLQWSNYSTMASNSEPRKYFSEAPGGPYKSHFGEQKSISIGA